MRTVSGPCPTAGVKVSDVETSISVTRCFVGLSLLYYVMYFYISKAVRYTASLNVIYFMGHGEILAESKKYISYKIQRTCQEKLLYCAWFCLRLTLPPFRTFYNKSSVLSIKDFSQYKLHLTLIFLKESTKEMWVCIKRHPYGVVLTVVRRDHFTTVRR
jgi:hypothetical protein